MTSWWLIKYHLTYQNKQWLKICWIIYDLLPWRHFTSLTTMAAIMLKIWKYTKNDVKNSKITFWLTLNEILLFVKHPLKNRFLKICGWFHKKVIKIISTFFKNPYQTFKKKIFQKFYFQNVWQVWTLVRNFVRKICDQMYEIHRETA